ncbi:hypothetical protein HNQ91_003453 [Filimonas zeae]|uniref:Uncharacterized protein n=1 Tax=Filimonas zeae TaxID=1737353 RepID=A0A917J1K6_9BACT|nr:hypothetical protein [Filimonas zeae]MDR6340388.1 hypothetical protein [Filimonas zeae]GGH72510.1 hypothetical protein GCM10011379_33010 [Filimonas zeae]
MSIATYSFLPYLRQGIANNLQSNGEARARFTVKLTVDGDGTAAPVEDKQIEVYGPGDIIGIDARSVVKTDPHNRVTNFEANYLPYIDFYDEDMPWRYTPVPASGQRLNPWITLLVLAAGEFDDGTAAGKPLPYITLKPGVDKSKCFPKAGQLWSWAHVHYNGDLSNAADKIITDNAGEVDAALDKLQQQLKQNPDLAYSRLLCPRKLKPGTSYHAFVIPSYESGRLAGLGGSAADIANAKLAIAWEGTAVDFPYYYRWQFSTGSTGDFEYLVRLLKPKVADSRVGRRVMDMTKPGANITWKEDADHPLGGILRLGGALKVPEESLTPQEIQKQNTFDKWAVNSAPNQHPFQQQLTGLLNLADDYHLKPSPAANTDAFNNSGLPVDPNTDADPLITPPIYGRWHAMVERVYTDRDGNRIDQNYNWLTELNLDPRFRVPAHFGTRVVQENQEDYMKAAWDQIGEVLKANNQIRYGQFAIAAGSALHTKHFVPGTAAAAAKNMMLTAPLQKRVLNDNATVFYALKQSTLPDTLLSPPMRRIARPRGRLATHLNKQLPAGEKLRLETLVNKVNEGELLPAPPKTKPAGQPGIDTFTGSIQPKVPAVILAILKQYSWLPWALLALAVLIVLLLQFFAVTGPAYTVGITIAVILVWLWYLLTSWQKNNKAADALQPENQTPESVDDYGKSPDFHLSYPGENFTPAVSGTVDNDNATRFKNSLKDMFVLLQWEQAQVPKEVKPITLDLPVVTGVILEQLKPEKTIPAWTWQHVFIPPWIKAQLVNEGFTEAMAYPKLNKPMYQDLKKISEELFLPNIELIAQNSITLLETNQAFIESYMVGLNHEFARELLWREYPTDQRGSYFRQFWDPSGALAQADLAGKTEEEQREAFYDIPKLHEWRRSSKLGDHDHRQQPGQPAKEEVVLVIRGELLKKYPTAVIYAHKAAWTINTQTGLPDPSLPRSLHIPAEGDAVNPNPAVVRTPLYSAKADPDIYFFGFDLTVPEARGEGNPQQPVLNNAGWFFVIKERPGEPRFGLDVPAADTGGKALVTWNDLDWNKVVPGEDGVIDVLSLPAPVSLPATHTFPADTEGDENKKQFNEDKLVKWDSNVDAANLAYILYQVPMMVCVHASEMLLQK